MSDRPWLQDGDPSLGTERALLQRLNAEQPPAGSAEQGWSAFAASISGMHVSPPAAAARVVPATKVAASSAVVVKIVIGIALTGTAGWTANALLKSRGAAPVAFPIQEVIATTEALPQRNDGAPEAVATGTADKGAAKIARPTNSSRPARSATTLAEEGRLLAEAHQLIQSGQPQQALEILRDSEQRYPHSVLAPEREVLTIEALGAAGESGVARQRAERFLKRNPGSAYTARLQRFLE